MWAPRRATREQILIFLRVGWFCNQHNIICFLHLNSNPWVQGDHSLRTITHGDHLLLSMRSEGYGWCDLEFSEGVERSRRVFESSDEEPIHEPPQEEQEESEEPEELSPYSVRSRSRERQNGHGREEDSDSLLQLPATPSTSPQQSSFGAAGGSLQPHVSDRWCAVGSPPVVDRITLALDSLIPAPSTVVELTGPPCSPPFPNHLEISNPVTPDNIAMELRNWGHDCIIQGTEDPTIFLCVSHTLLRGGDSFVYIDHEDSHHTFGRFLSTSTHMDEMDHMRYLATLGITRAAILQQLHIAPGITAIYFDVGAQGCLSSNTKEPGKPPPRQPSTTRRSYQPSFSDQRPAATLTLPITIDEIHNFFGSGENILVTSLEDVDLPRVCRDALNQCQQHLTYEDIDRLLIYVDGSSDPKHRHHHPAWVEEEGTEDTWAFVVLGEKYIDEVSSQTVFLGWSAQCIVHDPSAKCFAGAPRIGSDIAELGTLLVGTLEAKSWSQHTDLLLL